MSIENILAQGVQIRPAGMERNALMQAQEFKDRQQRNALLQMQMQDVSQQRQLAIQQAQQQAAATQARDSELGRVQSGGQFDPVALLRAGVPQAQIEFLANRGNLGRQEVARESERAGANGRPEKVFFDKFGSPVGQAMPQAVKMEMADQGGSRVAYDPYGLLPGQQMKKTQTPDSVASNATAMRGQNMQNDRAREDLTFKRETAGAKPSNATEDERKSAGYAVRMEDALRTLAAVDKTNPKATNPGVGTSLTNMLPEGVANYIRPEDRQRVEAAQLDALDAALTLATGAAYTKEQLKGLSRAYFAQPGDAETTKTEKADRLRTVVETARVRAGRSEPTIDPILNRTGPNAPGKPATGAAVQTATNPKTGEKLQLVNGQWAPAK